jgi:predicted RNase H-like nuclease (RuvC/YqgF family)
MQLVCPLCGKFTPEATLLAQDMALDDVLAVETTGLGRGRGFRHVRFSLLAQGDSPLLETVTDRIQVLARLLDVTDDIATVTQLRGDVAGKDRTLAGLGEQVVVMRRTAAILEAAIDEKDQLIEALSDDAVVATGEWTQQLEAKDQLIESLTETVTELQDEVTELQEQIATLEEEAEEDEEVMSDLAEETIVMSQAEYEAALIKKHLRR